MADSAVIRAIGGFEFEVTVTEQHVDELTITQHPVERGAAVTDHAFKNPAQLTVKAASSASFEDDLTDLYNQLLEMQASAEPIEVQTGKRLYENMLVKSLRVDTDMATENVLMVSVQLQEVILVDTLQTTMPSNGNRADPQGASGVADTGSKSAAAYNGPTP